MADLTGQQLGNYRLIQHLGRGGFADVYLGEHLYLRSLAALKLMHIALEGEAARNFLFEAQTLVRLNHRHIVRVLDFRIERGSPVLIMDYVQGGTLRQRHERGTCLALEVVVRYVKQIAEALQFAHNQQLIHRDVKPENVLLDQEHHLYLSDFGLALFAPSPGDLDTQKLVGTLPYTAPEQWQGHATFASDQYSLGVMAYEWLCGKRPFDGNYVALFSQHVYEPPPPLRDLCPELPEEVEQVILRALSKDPEQRFVSVRAFALALERASQEEITQTDLGKISPENRSAQAEEGNDETPVRRKLFLATATADTAFAEKLNKDLRQRGVQFSHHQHLPFKQEGELREAIRAAYLVMVVASPHMRTSRSIREYIRIALLYRRRLVFVWATGENIAASLLDLSGHTGPIDVIDARNDRYQKALDEIIDCLQEDTGLTPVVVPPLVSLNDEPRNPYKGLRPFTRDDASDFFGRDALIQRILGRLETMIDPRLPVKSQQRLLTVVGPSGSGKSSVVMAGVLPKLQRGALTGSEKWCYLETLVPGQHPCEALLTIVARQFSYKSRGEIRNILVAEHGYGLYQLSSFLSKPSNRRIVLCIDQFEELFAPSVAEAERQHFLRLLLIALSEPQSPLVVFLTLRADFYDRPMHYRDLAKLIEANQVSVLPMDNQEMRAAIERPTTQADVQLFFEGDLVGDILFELQGQSGALPLLEFVLEQLFQQRQGHLLTQEAYHEMGGLRGALARHAEEVYKRLPTEKHRQLAQTLFLRLIDPGKSEQDTTRRRAPLSELLFEDEEQTRLIGEVAYLFISARLLTSAVITNVTSIEVSHEALIREWPRLTDWLREAREDILLQHSIAADAANWQKHSQATDHLYRGIQLTEAVDWLSRNIANANEVTFIKASQNEQQRQKMEEEGRLRRELGLKRQTVQRQRAFITTLSVLLLMSIAFAFVTLILDGQMNRTVQERNATISKEKLDLETAQALALTSSAEANLQQNKLDLALLLANAATKKQDSLETRNSLLKTLEWSPQILKILHRPSPTIKMLAIDPGGQILVYSDGNLLTIDNGTTPKNFQTPDKDISIDGIALSPDGTLFATANNAGVWLWDTQKQVEVAKLEGALKNLASTTEPPAALMFRNDGQQLTSARCSLSTGTGDTLQCSEIQVSTWDIKSRKLVSTTQQIQTTVNIATFTLSSDGQYLATSNGNTIQIWNVKTGQQSATIPMNAPVNQLAFSHDSALLAVGMKNNMIQLWNLNTNQLSGNTFNGHKDTITQLVFSPDNQTLASSSLDTTVNLWDIASGKQIATLNGDGQPKLSIAFSHDGKIISSGSNNGNILLWNNKVHNPISQEETTFPLPIRSPLFSPDGTQVFYGQQNGKIEILPIKAGGQAISIDTTFLPINGTDKDPALFSIHSLALNKSGTILAAGRLDGTIMLWDVAKRKLLAHFIHPNLLDRIQLSSDGSLLVSDDTNGTVILWDVNRQKPLYSFSSNKNGIIQPPPVALSADGTLLALGTCANAQDQTCFQQYIRIWNIAQQSFEKQAAGPFAVVEALAFNPNNHELASITSPGNSLNEISLWNVGRQITMIKTPVTPPATGSQNDYGQLAFTGDGKKLIASTPLSQPFTFVVWTLAPDGLDLFADPIQLTEAGQGDISADFTGKRLISTHVVQNGGLLLLWNIDSTAWQGMACSIVQRNMESAEWTEYGNKDQSLKAICPQFPH